MYHVMKKYGFISLRLRFHHFILLLFNSLKSGNHTDNTHERFFYTIKNTHATRPNSGFVSNTVSAMIVKQQKADNKPILNKLMFSFLQLHNTQYWPTTFTTTTGNCGKHQQHLTTTMTPAKLQNAWYTSATQCTVKTRVPTKCMAHSCHPVHC